MDRNRNAPRYAISGGRGAFPTSYIRNAHHEKVNRYTTKHIERNSDSGSFSQNVSAITDGRDSDESSTSNARGEINTEILKSDVGAIDAGRMDKYSDSRFGFGFTSDKDSDMSRSGDTDSTRTKARRSLAERMRELDESEKLNSSSNSQGGVNPLGSFDGATGGEHGYPRGFKHDSNSRGLISGVKIGGDGLAPPDYRDDQTEDHNDVYNKSEGSDFGYNHYFAASMESDKKSLDSASKRGSQFSVSGSQMDRSDVYNTDRVQNSKLASDYNRNSIGGDRFGTVNASIPNSMKGKNDRLHNAGDLRRTRMSDDGDGLYSYSSSGGKAIVLDSDDLDGGRGSGALDKRSDSIERGSSPATGGGLTSDSLSLRSLTPRSDRVASRMSSSGLLNLSARLSGSIYSNASSAHNGAGASMSSFGRGASGSFIGTSRSVITDTPPVFYTGFDDSDEETPRVQIYSPYAQRTPFMIGSRVPRIDLGYKNFERLVEKMESSLNPNSSSSLKRSFYSRVSGNSSFRGDTSSERSLPVIGSSSRRDVAFSSKNFDLDTSSSRDRDTTATFDDGDYKPSLKQARREIDGSVTIGGRTGFGPHSRTDLPYKGNNPANAGDDDSHMPHSHTESHRRGTVSFTISEDGSGKSHSRDESHSEGSNSSSTMDKDSHEPHSHNETRHGRKSSSDSGNDDPHMSRSHKKLHNERRGSSATGIEDSHEPSTYKEGQHERSNPGYIENKFPAFEGGESVPAETHVLGSVGGKNFGSNKGPLAVEQDNPLNPRESSLQGASIPTSSTDRSSKMGATDGLNTSPNKEMQNKKDIQKEAPMGEGHSASFEQDADIVNEYEPMKNMRTGFSKNEENLSSYERDTKSSVSSPEQYSSAQNSRKKSKKKKDGHRKKKTGDRNKENVPLEIRPPPKLTKVSYDNEFDRVIGIQGHQTPLDILPLKVVEDYLRNLTQANISKTANYIYDRGLRSYAVQCLVLYSAQIPHKMDVYVDLLRRLVDEQYVSDGYFKYSNPLFLIKLIKASVVPKNVVCSHPLYDFFYKACFDKQIDSVIPQLAGAYTLAELQANNCALIEEICQFGYPKDSLGFCIKYDDIDQFKQVTSAPDFNFNMRIPCIDCIHYSRSTSFSLLSIAAFYGSVEVFRYLLEKGAYYTESTAKLSVLGGNWSIILYLTDRGYDFSKYVKIAVESHQNEIVDWIVDDHSDAIVPLTVAVKALNFSLISYILSRPNVDIEEKDKNGHTSLYVCVLNGYYEILDYLIKRGANVNVADNLSYTPLHIATIQGFIHIAQLIIKHGSEIDPKNEDGKTPLLLACEHSRLDILMILLDHAANKDVVDNKGISPLLAGAMRNDNQIVYQLLISGVDQRRRTQEGKTALHFAARNGNTYLVDLMIKYYKFKVDDTDDYGVTPLHMAAQCDNQEVVIYLLSSGAKVNKQDTRGRTPLTYAIMAGNTDIASVLISEGSSLNIRDGEGDSHLHYAVNYGQLEATKMLISKGSDVNRVNSSGWSPLHYACHVGHDEIVRLLIFSGADTTGVDKQGLMPVHIACQKGHLEVAKVLLDNGVDVDSRSAIGWTSLHFAAHGDFPDLCKLLVERNASLNVGDNSGSTPLHFACERCYRDVCAILLEGGASPDARDKEGRTPYVISKIKNDTQLCEMMESYKRS